MILTFPWVMSDCIRDRDRSMDGWLDKNRSSRVSRASLEIVNENDLAASCITSEGVAHACLQFRAGKISIPDHWTFRDMPETEGRQDHSPPHESCRLSASSGPYMTCAWVNSGEAKSLSRSFSTWDSPIFLAREISFTRRALAVSSIFLSPNERSFSRRSINKSR